MSTMRFLHGSNRRGSSVKIVIRDASPPISAAAFDAVAQLPQHARRPAVAEVDVLVIAHREN